METSHKRAGRIARSIAGVVPALISAFFIFYTIRLLYVTRMLTAIRAGGKGAYIGAIAFPILAIVFGLLSRHWMRKLAKSKI